MNITGRFSAYFDKGVNCWDLLFAFLHTNPSEKESTLKGNNLLPEVKVKEQYSKRK